MGLAGAVNCIFIVVTICDMAPRASISRTSKPGGSYITFHDLALEALRTSLVLQWLRLHTSNAGGLGSTPGRGTRSHKLQLRVLILRLKIPNATATNQVKPNK